MADRSESYDPSASEIEERAAIFDPDWEDAEDDDDDDDDDMEYEPAEEEIDGSDQEAFEDAEENILSALLENGDVEIEIADDDDDNEAEEEDEQGGAQTTGARPVFGECLLAALNEADLLMSASYSRSIATHRATACSKTPVRSTRSWTALRCGRRR